MKKDWRKTNLFMAPALLIALVGSTIFLMLTFGRGCQNVVHSFTEGVAVTEKGKEINNQLKPCPKCGGTKYLVYRKTKDGKDVLEKTDTEKDVLFKIICAGKRSSRQRFLRRYNKWRKYMFCKGWKMKMTAKPNPAHTVTVAESKLYSY